MKIQKMKDNSIHNNIKDRLRNKQIMYKTS